VLTAFTRVCGLYFYCMELLKASIYIMGPHPLGNIEASRSSMVILISGGVKKKSPKIFGHNFLNNEGSTKLTVAK
jgi:hypothetical protein